MLQIINISQARNNLATVVKNVKETGEPVVIVQDSNPAVVLYPYNEIAEKESKPLTSNADYAKKLLTIKGGWFSLKEFKKNRKQLNKRFSRYI